MCSYYYCDHLGLELNLYKLTNWAEKYDLDWSGNALFCESYSLRARHKLNILNELPWITRVLTFQPLFC